jgi:hypothetical protein
MGMLDKFFGGFVQIVPTFDKESNRFQNKGEKVYTFVQTK